MKPDARYSVKTEQDVAVLTIKDIKSSADQGKYKVILKNKIGQTESREASLIVSGKNNISKTI
jgi:hypothetical protein